MKDGCRGASKRKTGGEERNKGRRVSARDREESESKQETGVERERDMGMVEGES